MVDWKVAIEQERAALARIAALLHALAGRAELAAGRLLVRCFVLWLLRHAEAVARESAAMLPEGNSREDALRLAARLRALAIELNRQARLVGALSVEDCGEARVFGQLPAKATAVRAAVDALSAVATFAFPAAHPAPDTS